MLHHLLDLDLAAISEITGTSVGAVKNALHHGRSALGRRLAPEGINRRRKIIALVQRRMPQASPDSVDRAMRTLVLPGSGGARGIRTTIPPRPPPSG